MKIVLTLLIVLLTIIFFDVMMFFFLPNEYALNFNEYREDFQRDILAPNIGMQGPFSKDYFVKHEKRGFDNGKNKKGYHWVNGITYPIWSNSIGCFDKEHAQYEEYVYLTGDSYTWGYAPFHEKFGTVIENLTGIQILKCGITHTGQRHQYDKFVEIVEQIGILPKAIIVFYCANDIANDYAYPHSTVIDGWLVDNVGLDKDDKRVKISEIELRKSIDKKLLDLSVRGRSLEGRTWSQRVKYFLRQYSLSAHLMKSLVEKTDSTETPSAEKLSVRNLYFVDKDSTGRYMDHMDSNGQYWYGDNPKAINNKKAILAFKKFSTENNIPFVMVLMPFKTVYSNTEYYEQLRKFLSHDAIRFIDLTFHFRERHLARRDLYWSHDGHLNPSGNKIVAEILIKELPEVFSRN